MKPNHKISIVICTFGEAKFIGKVIVAICEQVYKNFEIVLVDNNTISRDFESLFKDYRIYHKIIRDPIPGLSDARNVGIKNSTGEYIVFLDDDAIPEKEWLGNIVKGFYAYNTDMIGGRVELNIEKVPWWLTKVSRLYLSELTYSNEDVNLLIPPRYVVGANMAFKNETFKKYGLFHSKSGRIGKKLISFEDVEIMRRIYYAGGKISFINSAKVIHMIPKDRLKIWYMLRRAFWQGISDTMLEKMQPLKNAKKGKKILSGFDFLLHMSRRLGRSAHILNFKNHNDKV